MMRTRIRHVRLLVAAASLVVVAGLPVQADFIELAYYHLGESDSNTAPGNDIAETIDEIGFQDEFRDMFEAVAGATYSDDVPPGFASNRSAEFDGGGFLTGPGTAWHSLYPGFRVGMEAFVKVDPGMEGADMVLFSNGSLYNMTVGADGYFYTNQSPPSETPVTYGQWQHVAFWTTGSFWQMYVDGEAQFDPQAEFNYGGGGDASIGASSSGDLPFEGLIDEHRIFTWTGAFNPGDLLYYQARSPGDVNQDGAVNADDYDIWRTNVGADLADLSRLEGRALGDLNVDGSIDLDDFSQIKANLTPAGLAALAPVPEPSTCVLLLIGLAVSALRVRRRGKRA